MLLVDSSVWIDYFNGVDNVATNFLHIAIGQSEIAVGDLILAEVLQGFRDAADFNAARDAMLLFPIVTMVGQEIAIRSAENYRMLRAQGITIRKTIDCLIATFCIENGIDLLHSDRDFDPFEIYLNLSVIHP